MLGDIFLITTILSVLPDIDLYRYLFYIYAMLLPDCTEAYVPRVVARNFSIILHRLIHLTRRLLVH